MNFPRFIPLSRIIPAGLTAGLLFLPTGLTAKRVALKVTADQDYVAARQTTTGEQTEQRYVFLEGEFLKGPFRDRSLESMEMIEVARALAPHLATQNFLPASDTGEADLVIAVHWGMTTSLRHNTDHVMFMMEQARDQQAADRELYNAHYTDDEGNDLPQADYAQELLRDAAAARAQSPDYEWARLTSARTQQEISARPVATVLGFQDVLNLDASRAFMGEEARTISAYLNEERYFVVLMAYDLKSSRNGGALDRVWVARLSVPAAGTNFPTALQRMGETSADHFGTHEPDLKIKRPGTRAPAGKVEIGEAIVVEEP